MLYWRGVSMSDPAKMTVPAALAVAAASFAGLAFGQSFPNRAPIEMGLILAPFVFVAAGGLAYWLGEMMLPRLDFPAIAVEEARRRIIGLGSIAALACFFVGWPALLAVAAATAGGAWGLTILARTARAPR